MLNKRLIPALLLRGNGLVKTTRFRDAKYVGDPINAIRIFNEKEVDELMVLDIDASRQGREPNYHLIEQFAGECFMPLAYGGGVRTVNQAKRIFSSGVEKVCIQTAALERPDFIRELADQFGSQSIVFSVDVKRNWRGQARVFHHIGARMLPGDWQEIVSRMVGAGAGEILLNSVERDGTLKGPDLDLIRSVSAAVSVPVVALGGVGSLEDVRAAMSAGASAVAAGAFFVYHGPHRAVLITYPKPSELRQLLHESE